MIVQTRINKVRTNELDKNNNKKLVELTSMIGVGFIGFGLGAYFSTYFQQYSLPIILIGITMHGIVMYQNLKKDKRDLLWVKILYWLCWAIIIGLIIFIGINLI